MVRNCRLQQVKMGRGARTDRRQHACKFTIALVEHTAIPVRCSRLPADGGFEVMDYQLHNPTRRCSTTGRDLRPGDRYFGTVLEHGSALERHDFAPEAWTGPPSGTIGHWVGQVPLTE